MTALAPRSAPCLLAGEGGDPLGWKLGVQKRPDLFGDSPVGNRASAPVAVDLGAPAHAFRHKIKLDVLKHRRGNALFGVVFGKQSREFADERAGELKRVGVAYRVVAAALADVEEIADAICADELIEQHARALRRSFLFLGHLAPPLCPSRSSPGRSFDHSWRHVNYTSLACRTYPHRGAECRSSCVGRPSASGEGGFA